MTIAVNLRTVGYVATAGQTVFGVPFPLTDAADRDALKVARARAGVEAVLVRGTDYVVDIVTGTTCNVRLLVGATLNDILVIDGARPIERNSAFVSAEAYRSGDHNNEIDRVIIMIQEIRRELARTLRRRPTDSGNNILPMERDRVPYIDAAGNLVSLDPNTLFGPQIAAANTAATNAAASAATATAQAATATTQATTATSAAAAAAASQAAALLSANNAATSAASAADSAANAALIVGGATVPNNTMQGNVSGSPAAAQPLTISTIKALLGYTPADLGLGAGGPVFATRLAAVAATVSAAMLSFDVMGFRAQGDLGHGHYVSIAAPGTPQPWHLKTADNRWFQLKEARPRPEQFGAYGDNASHPISADFANLAAAQVMFPFVTDTAAEWDWCALTASWRALPLSGGVVEMTGRYVVDRIFFVGDGTATSASTYQNITFQGAASGVQRNLITPPSTAPVNRTSIKCISASVIAAVVWILGPISCGMADFTINVNNLATRGHYAVHNMNNRFDRITVEYYRDFGFDLAAIENADTAAGVYNTHGDIVYNQCITAAPMLTTSHSVCVGNGSYTGPSSLDVARVAFVHCQWTSGDSSAAGGALLRFCDNIDFERCFFYSLTAKHCPILISPPAGWNAYPTAIRVTNCVTYGEQYWPALATWAPGDAGLHYNNLHLENRDRVALPYDIHGRVSGLEQSGVSFGRGSSPFYSVSKQSFSLSTTLTETTIATHSLRNFELGTSREALLRVRGFFRNARAVATDIRVRVKAAFGGPMLSVASATTVNPVHLNWLYQVAAGAAALPVNLPGTGFVANHRVWIENGSSNTVTVTPTGGATINSGGASLSLPPGGAYRCVADGAGNWVVTGVGLRATLADSGNLTQSPASSPTAGYRSFIIEHRLFGRNSQTSQASLMSLEMANTPNIMSGGAPTALSATTRYHQMLDAVALDSQAVMTLTVTFQFSAADALCDAYALHSSLELF